jgi:hypothetical protein
MTRCHCRPGCLSVVLPDDAVIATADGGALAEHVEPVEAYPMEPLFDLAGIAS